MPTVRGRIEHRMKHKPLGIDIGAASAARDVLELGRLDHLTVSVEAMHDYGGGREVQALREGRGRDRDP